MSNFNRGFFVFGSCAASQVALGLNCLRDEGHLAKNADIGYWAMPARYFNDSDSYYYSNNCVVIRNLHDRRLRKEAQGILNPRIDKTMSAFQTLPRSIKIPFSSWNPIYIYATPIFPFDTFIMIMEKYNEYLPSTGMIEDIATNLVSPQIELLRFLKGTSIDIIVVEGMHLFRMPIDLNAYNLVTATYTSIIKELIHKLDLPLLEYDKEKFMDKSGFTREEFRMTPNDSIHANDIYGKYTATNLVNLIRNTKFSTR